jgi:hypothetical protein
MEIWPMLVDAYHNGGWVLAASVIVKLLVSAYRWTPLQKILPAKMQWDSWPEWVKLLAIGGVAYGGGVLQGVAGHQSWPQVIYGGAEAAFGAIGLHRAEKAIRSFRPSIGKTPAEIVSAHAGREPPAL